jgi:hypothetical protein
VHFGLKQNLPDEAYILMRCRSRVKNGALSESLNIDKQDGQDRELKEGLTANRVNHFPLEFNKLNAGQVTPDFGQGDRRAYFTTSGLDWMVGSFCSAFSSCPSM